MENQKNSDVVVDRGEAKWSDLWLKEDYWAIWIGFFILLVSAFMIFAGGDIEKRMADYNAVIAAEKAKKQSGIFRWLSGELCLSANWSGLLRRAHGQSGTDGYL